MNLRRKPTFLSRKDSISRAKKSFRTSPDPESGQAILIRKIRALNLADILHLRKRSMVLFCALSRTTRLEQFQLAGPLSEKSQK
jgi:hypothetical protein